MQSVADAHVTPVRSADCAVAGGAAGVLSVQLVPSQCSMSACGEAAGVYDPTAQHAALELHATSLSAGNALALTGGDTTMVHTVLSQCSMRVSDPPPPFHQPTAQQSVVDAHVTPRRPPNCSPLGSGTSLIVQAAPSQCSTSGALPPPVTESRPVAQQLVVDGQASAYSVALSVAKGFGVVAMLQAVPSQCSASGAE